MSDWEYSPSEWRQLDAQHVIHPNTNLVEHERSGGLIMVKGEGSLVTDIDGREYIDGVGSLWLTNVGYGRRELAEAARWQMERLPYWSLFWGFGNLPSIALSKRLASLAPADLNHCFFTSGGSEANETSIKIARLYHARLGHPAKNMVVGLSQGYHGVSYGAMSATGLESVRANYAPYVGGFAHIPGPYCYRCPLQQEYPSCGVACAVALEAKVRELGPDKVAAFIAEPVVGVGGVIVPPPDYFGYIRSICDRYDILFIADEVITGFGRTGGWFGMEHWGVTPDIISCAKGITSGYMPLGASIMSDRVYDAIKGEGTDYFNHGFTYSGHPVAAAVALENLRIIESENLMARSVELGTYLKEQLNHTNNPWVGDVRGIGLMLGVELVQDRDTKSPPTNQDAHKMVESVCRSNGLIVRALAGGIIALAPPLVITRKQLNRLVEILDRVIREVFSAAH